MGALNGLGISAETQGELLADEVAMSQRLSGVGGIFVMVPAPELEQAQAALAEIRSGRSTEDETWVAEAEDELSANRGRTYTVTFLLIAVVVLVGLYVSALGKLSEYEGVESPLYDQEWTGSRWVYRWKDTGKLADVVHDGNGNGIYERMEYAPLDGVQERWADLDGDGRFDRREFVRVSDGEALSTDVDRGRDGFEHS